MNNYFNPDISMLREIPKAESQRLLAMAAPLAADPTALPVTPDTLQVDRLLHMIQFARQSDSVRYPALA